MGQTAATSVRKVPGSPDRSGSVKGVSDTPAALRQVGRLPRSPGEEQGGPRWYRNEGIQRQMGQTQDWLRQHCWSGCLGGCREEGTQAQGDKTVQDI